MTKTWIRSLQLGLGAVALCSLSLVQAQSAAPAEGAAPPPPAAAHAKPKHHAGKHHTGKQHTGKGHHHPHHPKGAAKHGHDRNDPAQREAAAAREQSRNGGLGRNESMDQYQRNALARCDVFKNDADRNSCAERVRQPGDGSVQGGGILREYTEEVRVPQ